MHVLRPLQQGESVEHRAGGLASRFPGDHNVTPDSGITAGIGNDEDRTAAFQGQPLGKVEQGGQIPVRIGLAGNDEVGGAAMIFSSASPMRCQMRV